MLSTLLFNMFLFWGYPVIASLSWLRNGVMFGLLILGWALLASSLVNYVKEQFLGLGSGSRELQVWGAVLGILLSSYQTFYWRENPLRRLVFVYPGDGGPSQLQQAVISMGYAVKRGYRLVFQTADVIFCVGAPLLVMTALVGWWLIDEITGTLIIIYLVLISIIALVGVYNNLVRMLALGYFHGYWLVDENKLSYPFEAPVGVYNNIQITLAKIGPDLLPLLSFSALILYALYLLLPSATTEPNQAHDDRGSVLKPSSLLGLDSYRRSLLTNVLLAGICLLAIPFGCLVLNALVDLVNIHCFFAALLILLLDYHWRQEFEQEPALCGDCRYFLSNLWRK